jgi:hypothetical protein
MFTATSPVIISYLPGAVKSHGPPGFAFSPTGWYTASIVAHAQAGDLGQGPSRQNWDNIGSIMRTERPLQPCPLSDFWSIDPDQREQILLEAIAQTHAWHFERNRSYRHTVAARGVSTRIGLDGPGPGGLQAVLPRLVRPTAQTFKSYIDILGTPFPQDQPRPFLRWLGDQLSMDLAPAAIIALRDRYPSLEALLQDIEGHFGDLGLEVLTSSGTSGRSTIMVRDRETTGFTVESFYLAFQRYLGMAGVQRAIFVMPRQTRIAMARMASFSVKRLGLDDDCIHFTIPFPAHPDQVRIRAGRTFRQGWPGTLERRFWHPFMNWMQEHYVNAKAVDGAVDLLAQAEAAGEKVLLFAGWIHLHAMALRLQEQGRVLRLAPGSLLGTGGGLKEAYPFAPDQIRRDLGQVIQRGDGQPVEVRDVYGMAEANWAAMQCQAGNYHIPPWIYARTLDDDGAFQEAPDATGLLAFLDPYGSGRLFPAFFKTADQVRLVRPQAGLGCPCGEDGAYITQDSIQRVDLLDEAGCAAQI